MGDRWIEEYQQIMRETCNSGLAGADWPYQEMQSRRAGDSRFDVPVRVPFPVSKMRGLFARYPMLYAIPVLIMGVFAFVLAVCLMLR